MLLLLVATAVVALATATLLGGEAHVVAARVAVVLPPRTLELVRLGATAGALVATALVSGGRLARAVHAPRAGADTERARADLLGIGVAAIVGVVGHTMLAPLTRDMGATAFGAGLGLLATSVALGSIGIARAPSSRVATLSTAALAGIGLALGALPGGAPIALAVAALAWSGTTEIDALEIATAAALPIHLVALARSLGEPTLAAVADDPAAAVAVGLVGLLAATSGLVAFRRLASAGLLSGVAAYTGALGLALLGYAYVAAP